MQNTQKFKIKRQTKKRKPRIDIVEFSFPKLLGFNFHGNGVKGLDKRPNKSPN